MDKEVNILLAPGGRRVSLAERFKYALGSRGVKGKVYSIDTDVLAPTSKVVDEVFWTPPVAAGEVFCEELQSLCAKKNVSVIVPTTDFMIDALIGRDFGRVVLTVDEKGYEICSSKFKTMDFFRSVGLQVPGFVENPVESEYPIAFEYPIFCRPDHDTGGRGAMKVDSRTEALCLGDKLRGMLCQDFISGDEFTVDVFKDMHENIVTIVPRKRIEVRHGEVSKAVVVKDEVIIEKCRRIAENLSFKGGICIQLFETSTRHLFTEINMRFGSGVILSMAAGADMAGWVVEMLLGEDLCPFYEYKAPFYMARADREFFNG